MQTAVALLKCLAGRSDILLHMRGTQLRRSRRDSHETAVCAVHVSCIWRKKQGDTLAKTAAPACIQSVGGSLDAEQPTELGHNRLADLNAPVPQVQHQPRA